MVAIFTRASHPFENDWSLRQSRHCYLIISSFVTIPICSMRAVRLFVAFLKIFFITAWFIPYSNYSATVVFSLNPTLLRHVQHFQNNKARQAALQLLPKLLGRRPSFGKFLVQCLTGDLGSVQQPNDAIFHDPLGFDIFQCLHREGIAGSTLIRIVAISL